MTTVIVIVALCLILYLLSIKYEPTEIPDEISEIEFIETHIVKPEPKFADSLAYLSKFGPPPASDEERLATEKFFQDAIEKIVQSASIGYSEYKLMPGSADGNGWSDTSLDKSNQWEINLNHLHSLFIQEGFGVQVSQNYLTIVWGNIKEDSDP